MSIFNFRSHLRRTPKKSRNVHCFTPHVGGLEGRQLMDGQVGLAVVNSSTGPSVVGKRFEIQAVQTNGLPYPPGVISSIDWTISGALDGRTLDTTGFHDTPFGANGTKTTIGPMADTVTGYWDGTTGAHTVTEVIHYTQPTWMGLPLPVYWPDTYTGVVNVSAPPAGVNFIPKDRAGVYHAPVSSGYKNYLMASAYYDVTVDGSYGGSFGVIQTVRTTSEELRSNLIGGADLIQTKTKPDGKSFVILDNSPKIDPNSPYYGTFSNVNPPNALTVPAGTILPLSDSPKDKLDDKTIRDSRSDQFTDQIVYTPPGGIPVVIGEFRWAWSASTSSPVSYGPKRTDNMANAPLSPSSPNPKWDLTSIQWKAAGFVRSRAWRDIAVPPELLNSPNDNTIQESLDAFPTPEGHAPMDYDFEGGMDTTPEQRWASATSQPMYSDDGSIPLLDQSSGHTDPLTGSWIPDSPAPSPPPVAPATPPPPANPAPPAPAPTPITYGPPGLAPELPE